MMILVWSATDSDTLVQSIVSTLTILPPFTAVLLTMRVRACTQTLRSSKDISVLLTQLLSRLNSLLF